MKLDTLKCQRNVQLSLTQISQVLTAEQKKFFVTKGLEPAAFASGAKIVAPLNTKLGSPAVAEITLTKLTADEICLETSSPTGVIAQGYRLQKISQHKTKVVYWETNTFAKNRDQYQFFLIALLYKFSFNRGVTKRIKYLEAQGKKIGND